MPYAPGGGNRNKPPTKKLPSTSISINTSLIILPINYISEIFTASLNKKNMIKYFFIPTYQQNVITSELYGIKWPRHSSGG
jgi:hypothetical protein